MSTSAPSIGRWRFRLPGLLFLLLTCLAYRAAAQDQGSGGWPGAAERDTASPGSATEPPLNTLEGIVVSKIDGTPQAKVTIAFAHAKNGYIHVVEEGAIQVYGGAPPDADEPTRNYKTVIKTRTDDNGRFKLKNFASMSDEYTLLASTKSRGVALLRGVVPENYRDKPLRIELEPCATVKVLVPRYVVPKGARAYIGLGLEAEVVGHEADGAPKYAETGANVSFSSDSGAGARKAEFGHLVPGLAYRLSVSLSKTDLPYSPTVIEQVVRPKAGETVTLFPDPSKDESLPRGATLTGTINGTDGKPLRDVNVRLCRGTAREAVRGAITNADGHYQIPYVLPGDYRVELEHRRARTVPG